LQPGRAAELKPVLQGAFTYGRPDDPVDTRRQPHLDARRFEPGSPTFLGAAGGAAAARLLLDAGIENVHRAALAIADRIADGASARGGRVLSSRCGPLRSPIVTWVPARPIAQVEAALHDRQIAYAHRAGGIRISPHAFNNDSDLNRLFEALDAA
jgi:selenocysteine lyase/cysteine desulfurase